MKAGALTGRWKHESSSVVYEIREDAGTLHVSAVDSDDGEVLRVEDVRLVDETLCFVLVTPSTEWTVNVEIEPRQDGSVGIATTLVADLERIT